MYAQFQDNFSNLSAVYSDDIVVNYPMSVFDISVITPNPRNLPVNSVDVLFTEQANLATFTYLDVTLKRNGGSVPLSGTVTISLIAGSPGNTYSYRVNGLTTFTSLPGNYALTVNATNILDTQGFGGRGAVTVSWEMCSAEPGVVYVNGAYQGTLTNGAPCTPFRMVNDGYQTAQSGNTIRVAVGTYPELLVFSNKVLRVESTNGVVIIGHH